MQVLSALQGCGFGAVTPGGSAIVPSTLILSAPTQTKGFRIVNHIIEDTTHPVSAVLYQSIIYILATHDLSLV